MATLLKKNVISTKPIQIQPSKLAVTNVKPANGATDQRTAAKKIVSNGSGNSKQFTSTIVKPSQELPDSTVNDLKSPEKPKNIPVTSSLKVNSKITTSLKTKVPSVSTNNPALKPSDSSKTTKIMSPTSGNSRKVNSSPSPKNSASDIISKATTVKTSSTKCTIISVSKSSSVNLADSSSNVSSSTSTLKTKKVEPATKLSPSVIKSKTVASSTGMKLSSPLKTKTVVKSTLNSPTKSTSKPVANVSTGTKQMKPVVSSKLSLKLKTTVVAKPVLVTKNIDSKNLKTVKFDELNSITNVSNAITVINDENVVKNADSCVVEICEANSTSNTFNIDVDSESESSPEVYHEKINICDCSVENTNDNTACELEIEKSDKLLNLGQQTFDEQNRKINEEEASGLYNKIAEQLLQVQGLTIGEFELESTIKASAVGICDLKSKSEECENDCSVPPVYENITNINFGSIENSLVVKDANNEVELNGNTNENDLSKKLEIKSDENVVLDIEQHNENTSEIHVPVLENDESEDYVLIKNINEFEINDNKNNGVNAYFKEIPVNENECESSSKETCNATIQNSSQNEISDTNHELNDVHFKTCSRSQNATNENNFESILINNAENIEDKEDEVNELETKNFNIEKCAVNEIDIKEDHYSACINLNDEHNECNNFIIVNDELQQVADCDKNGIEQCNTENFIIINNEFRSSKELGFNNKTNNNYLQEKIDCNENKILMLNNNEIENNNNACDSTSSYFLNNEDDGDRENEDDSNVISEESITYAEAVKQPRKSSQDYDSTSNISEDKLSINDDFEIDQYSKKNLDNYSIDNLRVQYPDEQFKTVRRKRNKKNKKSQVINMQVDESTSLNENRDNDDIGNVHYVKKKKSKKNKSKKYKEIFEQKHTQQVESEIIVTNHVWKSIWHEDNN